MKFAVIVFPGSNCDHDAHYALTEVLGQQVNLVWHKDQDLGGADVVVLPGGFSYGDYLRTGAIAKFSPVMSRVTDFAAAGGPVIGICNGFQVLLEAGLLPGGMRRNPDIASRRQFQPARPVRTAPWPHRTSGPAWVISSLQPRPRLLAIACSTASSSRP